MRILELLRTLSHYFNQNAKRSLKGTFCDKSAYVVYHGRTVILSHFPGDACPHPCSQSDLHFSFPFSQLHCHFSFIKKMRPLVLNED